MSLLAAVLEELRRRREPWRTLTEEQAQENVRPRKSAAVLRVGPSHTASMWPSMFSSSDLDDLEHEAAQRRARRAMVRARITPLLGPGPGQDGHGE